MSEAAGVFTLTSKRYGSGSTLSVGGSAAATLFGAAPTTTAGLDVAGTIGGFSATGSGPASDRRGRLAHHRTGAGCHRWLHRQPRNRELRTRLRGPPRRPAARACWERDGAIASRTTGINATIKDLDRQRDVLDRRLAQIEARYRKQFTALDTLMSSMTATSTFLTQQLQQLQQLQSSSG